MSNADTNSDEHDPSNAASIQPSATEDVLSTVEQRISNRVLDRLDEQNRNVEADIRQLLDMAEKALSGEGAHDPATLIETIHYYLINDDRVTGLLSPVDDTLDPQTKLRFQMHRRQREQGQQPPLEQELATQNQIAIGLEIIYSTEDKTRYIPVRMENLDIRGASSPVTGEPTPIGRRRVGKHETLDELSEDITITHEDCEHVLVVALPRQGKDSTITSMCGNLMEEHGYKWFSCLDDGRNETPMTAVPNAEEPILENLEEFGQEPTGYDARVFVPDTDGAPDVLPANFERFTIGLDDLTPRLLLRLAGVDTGDANTMRRIGQAQQETLDADEGVEHLVSLLYDYSEDVEATITVRRLEQDEFIEQEDGTKRVTDADEVEADASVREVSYEMGADKALQDAAESLMMLAGEGLVADPGESTNLDIEQEFRQQDRVAVLNCNFLRDRNEALKYVILNLWLRLIFRQRDENPRLPRALLEIRELKDIAPSVIGNAKYKAEIKALQSTIYEIATRGGSRRVMMLGSTQKLNDIYKAVRTNMPIKILLRLGEEEIRTLDKPYSFSPAQEYQLQTFSVGQGMLLKEGEAYWPIMWRGAPCGLGLGDVPWRDRYGTAWGARVYDREQHRYDDAFSKAEAYVSTKSGIVYDLDVDDDNGCEPDDGEWLLFWSDIRETLPVALPNDPADAPGQISHEVVQRVLETRRDNRVRTDLSLQYAGETTSRSLSFANVDEKQEEKRRQILDQHNVPKPLEGWIGTNVSETRERKLKVLREVGHAPDGEITRLEELEDRTGLSTSAISRWRSHKEGFRKCLTKTGGAYAVTKVGQRALDVEWEKLDTML